MCSGGSKRKPSQTGLIKGQEYVKQEGQHHNISALLEFSAIDDVIAFKNAIEKDGQDIDEVGLWYGRKIGSKEMCYEERTPLMIAAMCGSKDVLSYILETGRVDVNQACGSDKATPLHCAVAGGSTSSPEIVKLLLNASADVSSVDAKGNKSSDLIVSLPNSIFNSRKRILQAILQGVDYIDDVVSTLRTEKKNYPIDRSLPDIKNDIYSTDEFRMFTFKVMPCSRAYSHDWTECPFVHPGENARRRDPMKYSYSCVPCPEYRKGSCSKGDSCEYAHGIFECWLHPAQYRTRLCKDETRCNRRVCFFAHKVEELRPLYASTGSGLPSPTASSMDSFSLESPSSLVSSSSTSPLGGSSPGSGTMWPTQLPYAAVPTLQQLPISRLKTTMNGRDSDLDIGLLGLENRLKQKLLMEEMVGLSSPSKWNNSMHNSPSFPEDIFASQNANQQIWGYAFDLSTEAMDPRYAAFSKRSQSFIERGVVNSNSDLHSPATTVSVEASAFSDWGSPDGKLDWAICGDELNKLRKSCSFGFRNRSSTLTVAATTEVEPNVDEPDVSWVNSLVKDVPTLEFDLYNRSDTVPYWPEHLYMEQEQIAA